MSWGRVTVTTTDGSQHSGGLSCNNAKGVQLDNERWFNREDVVSIVAERTPLKVEDLKQGLLVQTKANEVLKVSTVYDDNRVSAEVVYPLPGRTTVRFYTAAEVATWREPSDQIIARYEIAWGFR